MPPPNTSNFEISLFSLSKHTEVLTLMICLYMWPKMLLVQGGQRRPHACYNALKVMVG